MVPLDVTLPGAAFKGTPTNIQTNSYTEPYSDAPPAPMMVPEVSRISPERKAQQQQHQRQRGKTFENRGRR